MVNPGSAAHPHLPHPASPRTAVAGASWPSGLAEAAQADADPAAVTPHAAPLSLVVQPEGPAVPLAMPVHAALTSRGGVDTQLEAALLHLQPPNALSNQTSARVGMQGLAWADPRVSAEGQLGL